MSAMKELFYELEEFVWLIEFAGLTFEERGKANELLRVWYEKNFSPEGQQFDELNEWFDTAYELIEQDGGADWAKGLEAERLLGMVRG
jgi:hypothetical protein